VERAFKNLEQFFGLYRAVDITTDRIMQYVTTRQDESIKASTYKYELAVLKRAFNLAIAAEKLDHKPHFPKIEVHNTRERFFTEAEFQSVLSHLPAEVQPLVEFLWLTGWRVHKESQGPRVAPGGLG
jgi:integrase